MKRISVSIKRISLNFDLVMTRDKVSFMNMSPNEGTLANYYDLGVILAFIKAILGHRRPEIVFDQ